ncbi:MAG: DinB family protein [Flavobacteriales bacterium]|nr:DinB family protein [Flavobacteriales bacterium]
MRTLDLLCKRTSRWSESDLERYLLPHPLLGKLTLREMLYFTLYHVQHHQALVQRDTA